MQNYKEVNPCQINHNLNLKRIFKDSGHEYYKIYLVSQKKKMKEKSRKYLGNYEGIFVSIQKKKSITLKL